MKRHPLFVALAALAFGAATAVAAPPPTTAVTVQAVRVQTLEQTARVYGQLAPNPEALRWLSAALAGRIEAVYVTVGATVHAGQKLAFIKPTPQTLASFQSAQSNLVAAQSKLKQTKALARNGLATRSDLAAAKGAVATAKARLTALKSEGVSSHGETLKAKHNGVVTQLAVAQGQWVTVGARIAALAPAGKLWVRLGLTPKEAAHVKPGSSVRLASVFGVGKTVSGKVARVAGRANPTTGLIDADVPIPASGTGFYVGQWVTGTIVLRRLTLPAVPRSAVLKDNRGYYVFIVRNGKAHRVQVTPCVRARGLVGLAGIEPGARVVTQGNFELSDGAAVRAASPQTAPALAS